MTKQVLIVDDDRLLCRSLGFSIQKAGYKTDTANSAEDGLKVIQRSKPDLVLLDIGLPAMDGLDTLRVIRSKFSLPVIIVTARRRELDEIIGLEVGADDYVTKPFDTDVLLARIKAVLRRSSRLSPISVSRNLTVGKLKIDTRSHSVYVDKNRVELSPKEFQLLLVFAQHINYVFSVDELVHMVWGDQWVGESQTIYVHIRWLRQKIETNPARPKHLITVRGAGYKFVP